MALVKLELAIQWIGRDGEPRLRSDLEPKLIESVLKGESAVGWGESVKFDLTPRDEAGVDIGAADTRYPTISWRVQVETFGEATLDADPNREGDVDEAGVPVSIGTRPYDQAKGYGLKVTPGWRKPAGGFKPASGGRLKYTVYAFDVLSDIRSNEVSFVAS